MRQSSKKPTRPTSASVRGGNNFRQLRLTFNRTLESVASEVDIHPSHLSKIERGVVKPSSLVELKLEAALQSTPREDSLEPEQENGKLDPRNRFNDLTGREWIQATTTVWRQKGLGVKHPHTKYEKLHPAPFSFQDIARLIQFFTKKGMLVLDPFVGVGSTLKAAALEGRRGIGIELSPKWAELARLRLKEEVPDDSSQQIWCMDVRDAITKLEANSVHFIVTSPPYWGILNKKADHKVKEVRLAEGLDQNYSDDPRDLANIQSYDRFVKSLTEIFGALSDKLVPGRYCVIIASDFKHGDRFYPYHSDLYTHIDPKKLRLQGVAVLYQTHKSLYPYGYPFAYVPNIHHQYILIFQRPKARKVKRVLHESTLKIPTNTQERLRVLGRLPHKQGRMASRHWGHQRHSICSFPSKMKPALASVLVELFSLPGSVVLDPLAGCGSIPFEAALQGRTAIANDISPLAYVISSAKINPPKEQECNALLDDLEKYIRDTYAEQSLKEMEPEIQDFYHQDTAKEIIAARTFLSGVSNGFRSNRAAIFLTACLAHILHGNRPYALSRRSHNIIPIPPKGPRTYKPVMTSLRDKCQRMLALPLPPSFKRGTCYCKAADALPIADETVDVVITSPPFLGSTHFLRQNRVRNWFLGWDYEKQTNLRGTFLEHAADISVYKPILKELRRVVRRGGLTVFHVGIVKTQNMADLLRPLFQKYGFSDLGTVWEDTTTLESHGRTDRGGTHTHGFVILRKE